MTFTKLLKKLKVNKSKNNLITGSLKKLSAKGIIINTGNKIILDEKKKFIKAEIVKISTSFGFARSLSSNPDECIDYFIPGRALKGAMMGDIVLIKEKRSLGESPEATVEHITEYTKNGFTGVFHDNEDGMYVIPDSMNIPIKLDSFNLLDAKDGDKVYAEIVRRGERHFDHTSEIVKVFGSSDIAAVCAESVLAEHNIKLTFPDDVINSAKEISKYEITQSDLANRSDFRDKVIFTIDSEYAKDLDDAVSLSKDKDGYILGVHIADVSHYVKRNSPIEKEAFERGTSIYYANKVIPMLPTELSNGICSLNPNEDRLTFSALIKLSNDGQILKFDFQKSVIHSKVKGIYREINSILENNADEQIIEKYHDLISTINLMKELADILTASRIKRGAFELETNESQLIIGENKKCTGVVSRERGIGERIIEEFMLVANEAASTFAIAHDIPFLHRIHEKPSLSKVAEMSDTLSILGLSKKPIEGTISQKQVGRLLEKVKNTPLAPVINHRILRMMSKAKYSHQPIGHYGLVLKHYSHFTSPIRRYPDLCIHHIMSDVLAKGRSEAKKYSKFVVKAGVQSSDREITATTIERDCEDLYKAEYMKQFVGDIFDGTIVGIAPHGIFVELPNTVEGRVALDSLPEGDYKVEGNIRYKNTITGQMYTVGDSVKIQVVKAEVSSGTIDFIFVNDN